MALKSVILDKEKIFPTHFPRVGSSLDLARAEKLDDINLEGAELDESDGMYFVREGHHRIGRALELAEGKEIVIEVQQADAQTQLNIYGAMEQCARFGEQINYSDFIRKMRWHRKEY